MTEPKFKPGDKVWSVLNGLVTLSSTDKPVYKIWDGQYTHDEFGKINVADKFPSLYTLDEARAMGFPVPKEKMKFSVDVEVKGVPSGKVWLESDKSLNELIGKRGKMIFEEE